MDILYEDSRILVCIKPAGVLSAGDEPGGMVDLLRRELEDEHACVRSVHRLDAQVSGLMVFARSQAAAGILSEQVRERVFEKEYLAVVHGKLKDASGQMEDLLWYNRSLRKSRVMDAPGKDVKRALLSYDVLGYAERADASDPHPVFLPRSRALRRPEIRRGRRGRLCVHCALVVAACVLAPAK